MHWRTADYMSAAFQVAWHRAIIAGTGPYPDQYRVLTYWLAEWLIRAGLQFQFAYALIRFVFTAGALLVFARYLSRWFGTTASVLGVLLLAWGHPLTAAYEAMAPTDPLNLLVFAIAFELLAAEKDWWIVPLVTIGTLNRETALVLVPMYAILRRRWPVTLVSGIAGAAAYLAPRAIYGLRPAYAETSPLTYLRVNITDWAAWVIVIAFFNLGIVLVWVGLRRAPQFLRRAAWLAPLLIVVYGTVGCLREIRFLLPALLVTIPLTLYGIDRPQKASISTE